MQQVVQPVLERLSHSKTEDLDKCAYYFAAANIWKWPRVPNRYLILGNLCHDSFEWYANRWLAGRPPTLAGLQRRFTRRLTGLCKQFDPYGFMASEYPTFLQNGLKVLAVFYREVVPAYTWEAAEWPFDNEVGGFARLRGRIDAFLIDKQGRHLIGDYKILSKPWAEGLEHHKLQATAYVLATDLNQITRPDAVQFLTFVPDGDDYRVDIRETTRSSQDVALYIAYLAECEEKIRRARASQQWEPHTGPLCSWCGVLGFCHEGLVFARSHKWGIQTPLLEPAV